MARKGGQAELVCEFELPVLELDRRINELRERETEKGEDNTEEIQGLEEKRDQTLSDIVAALTPYQRVKLARHPLRPQSRDYIRMIFEDFVELHGDRRFGDDKAIITGPARIEGIRLMLVAQQKGKDTNDKMAHNFGMPNPEGYRKAYAKMNLAEKFGLPVVCMIDTPGAAPAVEAEERGQAMAIAENIFQMMGLRTPIVILIIGEGCSGGALGIGVGDRFAMLENAYFSVISPEGCAAILWRDAAMAEEAAEALKLTAQDMLQQGISDCSIAEPVGGAHRDPEQAAANIKAWLLDTLKALREIPLERLLDERHGRYRALGEYTGV